jgi:arylsulfatase A-like enzyme
MLRDAGGGGNNRSVRISLPRAWGAVFLATAPWALAAGIFESAVSDRYVPPRFGDILYGANLHVLLAAVACLVVGLVARRSSVRKLGGLALGSVLGVEGGVVGGYWAGTVPGFPHFYLLAGKLLTAGVALGGALLGILAGRLLAGRLSAASWDRLARSSAGICGLALMAGLLVLNAVIAVASYPRPVKAAVRADAAARERPDVILILVDTLRRDHLGYFGYERPTSTRLAQFFDQSYVFTHAYTPSTWTTPSVASLFTGLYPTSHGVLSAIHALPQGLPTLAEHFRSYGYATGGFVGNQILTARNGFSQGFEFFFPQEPPFWCHHLRTAFERIAKQATRPSMVSQGWRLNVEARRWLEHATGRPRFAYVHYVEPHSPYEPPSKNRDAVAPDAPPGPKDPPLFRDYRSALRGSDCCDWECLADPPTLPPADLTGMIANYDGEVHRADRYVGTLLRFLDELGMLDRCHIIFCTDHGEEFFEHHGWFHGNSIYEEITGCPLAYRPPGGLPGPVRIDRPVAQLDLVRTLFTMLAMEPPPMHQGREIPELLGGEPPVPAPPVLSELPPTLYSLRHGNWKLIQRGSQSAPDWRLFDLAHDAAEQNDLAGAYPDTLRMLRGWLDDIVATHARVMVQPGVITDDPEMLRDLRNLGYIK